VAGLVAESLIVPAFSASAVVAL